MKRIDAARYANAALANAADLYRESALLLQNGCNARALCLAVLGQEEVGKGMFVVLQLLSRDPFDCSRIGRAARLHVDKQVQSQIALLLSYAARLPQIDALIERMHRDEGSTDGPATQEQLMEVSAIIERHAADLVASLEDSYPSEEPIAVQEVVRAIDRAKSGELDKMKQSGFYVDYCRSSNHVSTPQSLSRDEARSEVEALRAKLEARVHIDFVFQLDEGALEVLCKGLATAARQLILRSPASSTSKTSESGAAPP